MANNPLTSWLPVKSKKLRRTNGIKVHLERLEDRNAPAIFTVTWDGYGVQPGGTKSLQERILEANASPGADTINFAAGITKVRVLSVAAGGQNGPLPDITDTLTIDGGGTKVTINLESAKAADPVNGFHVTGAAANSIIRNVTIMDPSGIAFFNGPTPEYGVKVSAASGGFKLENVGIFAIDGDAVRIVDSPNNTIGGAGVNQGVIIGNVPTPNNRHGVWITGAKSTGNLVQQTTIDSNAGDGVLIDGGSANNFIGDVTALAGNTIKSNLGSGIRLNNSNGNRIQRNRIGNDGSVTLANALHGILVENGSSNNTIGGNDQATANVISGNAGNGVYIKDATSSGNQVQANLIGLNAAGDVVLANQANGILVENAPNTLIGNTSTIANYISGNALHGISIFGAGAAGTIVVNSRIGLNLAEDNKIGNTRDGISVNGTTNITIGGSSTNANNFIVGNRNGIAITGSSTLVTIQGNQIGLNKASTKMGNLVDGILIDNSSKIQIGGTLAGTGNTISGNVAGIRAFKSDTLTIQGNAIGTNLTLDKTVPNTGDGIVIDTTTNVSVGTPGGSGGNLISGNLRGVHILNGSSNVRVQNNRIGTLNDPTKVPDLGNLDDGVRVSGSTNVTIGGTSPLSGNTLAKNADGIEITNLSSNVIIQGNLIRNNAGSGVRVQNSSLVTIGGETAAAANTIANTRKYAGASFNMDGVLLVAGAKNNIVQGNWIGTDATLNRTFGNRGNGILIDGSSNNLIGGTLAGTGNTIAYNWQNGVAVIEDSGGPGSANANRIWGNSIYGNGSFKFSGLGINLNTTGGFVDLNDAGDVDLGANNTQNFPEITKADVIGSGTSIDYKLNGVAGRTYRVEFYGTDEPNQTGSPTEYGQGKLFLGFKNVTLDATGNITDNFLSPTALQPLWVVTATATDLTTNDTSEFSKAMYVNTPGPNTYVVNNDGGFYTTLGNPNLRVLNGTMTLARAIELANQHPGTDRIVFALRPQVTVTTNTTGAPVFTYVGNSRTVLIDTNLPDITDTVVIDGARAAWPQNPVDVPYPGAPADSGAAPDYTLKFRNATNGIVISDDQLPADKLLNPNANAQLVVIRNFPEITGINGVGITIRTAKGGANLQNIQGPGGLTGLNGINGFVNGAVLIDNSPNNIIGGADVGQGITINKIGTGNGVHITGKLSTGNLVQQTKIGNVFGVGGDGILIDNLASNNIIGGFTSSPVNTGNQIVRSNKHGIHIRNSNGNRIQRNFIGNDGADTAIPNALNGIFIEDSSFNLIGGQDLAAKNLISGNTENGIYISGATSKNNQIQSNFIGLNSAGDAALPNSGSGIWVDNAPSTLVGSTTTAANYISGNNLHGIRITGVGSTGTTVVNNRIGLNFVGDKKIGNVEDGINISGATGITVGGGVTKAVNIIGGNRHGVAIINKSSNVIVRGNHLGLNKLPDNTYPAVGNLQDGVFVQDSSNITIGGTQSLEGNKAAANRFGIHIVDSDGVLMQGNYIGTNLTGTIIPITIGLVENFQPAGNSEDGIRIEGSTNVKVGTPAQFGGNLMSRNRHGVSVTKGSSNVTIQNNRIGLQSPSPPSKTPHDLGNLDDGVFVDASTNVTIGGTGPSDGNQIAKNLDGIQISGGSKFVVVQGNTIRNNNQSGVRIESSSFNTVGGSSVAARNTILNRRLIIDTTFNQDGVFLVNGSTDNVVAGNYIGTDGSNDITLGNKANGILVDGSSNNLIGEQFTGLPTVADPQTSNVIAYNAFNGIAVVESTGTAKGNRLLGNSIFNNGRLGIDLDGTAGFVTLNDLGDPDTGANNKQNFPMLALAESDASIGIRVQGALNSTPNSKFRIEFFHVDVANPTGNPPNYGQGKTYIGFMDVTTDAVGDATFTFQNTNLVLPSNEFITATATSSTGDTSEMSLGQVISGAVGPATYIVNHDGDLFPTEGADLLIPPNGTMKLSTAIRLANERPGPDRIFFALHPQYTIDDNGNITYYQESRNLFTEGDLPDITDSLLIDGSYLATPQEKGGEKRFTQNYGIIFKNSSRGFRISDNPTPQSKFSNPNGKAELVVIRHFRDISGPAGVGIDIITKWGGANLQDIHISGFGGDGVRIINSPNNIIGGSGANQAVSIQNVNGSGVNILGSASTGNIIQQVNIGTEFGVGGNGIWIQGANDNTIGGFVTGTGNNIRGSALNGVYILNSHGTRIQRSTIGDTTNLFPNKLDGIRIENSGVSPVTKNPTLIGGVTAAAGNIIAGNTENGIRVLGAQSAGLLIQSNQIGTTTAPNSGNGILVDNAPNVLIGSTVTAANNVDGNNLNGIYIRGASSNGARIVNTSVGKNGGNVEEGILIDGTDDVIIGGGASNAGGTIAGNKRGIHLKNAADKITVQQYVITGNSEEGVRIDGSAGVLIGGTSAKAGNTITNNRDGVRAINSDVVTLQGNQILNQSEDGVIIDGAGNVVVGSAAQFGGNTINGNRNGVRVINNSKNFRIENNTLNANDDDAIRLDGITGAVVGGTLPLSPNKASGNRNGLRLTNGTKGTLVLGNTFANSVENGIAMEGSSNNTIGGKSISERNFIFGNTRDGIFIGPDFTNPLVPVYSNGNIIQGNSIGVNAIGQNAGNGNTGVYIDGGNNNLIGGTLHDVTNKFDHGNIIANSGKNGVAVVMDNGPANGNQILGNSIFGNALLGIDLNSNLGLVDFNDSKDVDTGANNLQNFPIIDFAEAGLVSSLVSGKFNSTPNRNFRLEFFADTAANPGGTPPGYGQGKQYLGFTQVTTDANGDAIYSFFAPVSLGASGVVSATATDLVTLETSEFAESKAVQVAVGKIEGFKFEDQNGNGIRDPGEPGLPGWVIELEVADSAGNFDGKVDAKATTDATGRYEFATLTDGKYKLAEVLQTGWVQTVGPNPNPVQITGGATVSNADFGNFKTVKVFGVKFEDKNGNGTRDPGEGPIAGVVINLIDAKTNTTFATTKTDLSGNYAFTGLYIGKFGKADTGFYRVREVVPAGYLQTTPNPADFQITSGKDVGPLDFGNKKTGGGGGAGNNIIVVGSDAGRRAEVKGYSAQSGAQLFSLLPYGGFTGGVRVAKGDVNGDGTLDIITGAGPGGGPHIRVFNGGDVSQELHSFMAFAPTMTRGVYVASGDVNKDGFADIIVGTGAGVVTRVKVFDGQTLIELFDFTPYNPFFQGGVTVAAGDVNGDGYADIITGAGPGGGPHVRVFDGSQFGQGTGFVPTELWGFMAHNPIYRTGVFVSSGNIDNDGRADIITGIATASVYVPSVRVWSGGTKTMLYQFNAFTDINSSLPSSLWVGDARYVAPIRVGVIDFNGDGIDDIATAPGRGRPARVRVYDGVVANPRTRLFDTVPFDPTATGSSFLGGVFVG